jgi:hypothetical protein
MCRITSLSRVSAAFIVMMLLPSRSTVMRSEIANTSSSLCEM